MENLILVVSIAVVIVLERMPRLRFEPRAFLRGFFRDDLVCLLTSGIALGLLMRAAASRYSESVPLGDFLGALPLIVTVPAALVFYDLGAWLTHAALHRFESLWEIHKVHHSSRRLDWLATFRAHFVEHALRHLVSMVPLVLVGFPPLAVGAAAAIHTSFAVFNHSNFRHSLRFLEPLFITPRLHRLHHVPATSEKNLGTLLSLWDRLAGRLEDDPAAATTPLGVPGEIATYPQTWSAFTREPLRRIGRARGVSASYG